MHIIANDIILENYKNFNDFKKLSNKLEDKNSIFYSPICAEEISAIVVIVGNFDAERLRSWVGHIFESIEVQDCEFGSEPNPALFDPRFAFVLMAGDDPKRLCSLYRSSEATLRNRIVVGIVTGSSPKTRSLMLRAGFDDVLDIEKKHTMEAIARFRAIWRRHCERLAIDREEQRRSDMLDMVCPEGNLSAREIRLLECLLERRGWCVPSERLQRIAGSGKDPISIINLRVSLTKLRRKLAPGTLITPLPQEGYILTFSPDCCSAEVGSSSFRMVV